MKKSLATIAGIGMLEFLAFPKNSEASTHYVSPSGSHVYPYDSWENASTNIQDAISAGQDFENEVIIGDGTYSSPKDRNLWWTDKVVIVKSANGNKNCVIDCKNEDRAFKLDAYQTRDDTLEGLTIINGKAHDPYQGNNDYHGGGAIWCEDSSPTITNCVFKYNKADVSPEDIYADGGAISCSSDSSPLIIDCDFIENQATHTGGAISADDSDPSIKECKFVKNHSNGCYGGGAISMSLSYGEIYNCLIYSNTAHFYSFGGGYGSGILCLNSNPEIYNCTLTANSTKNGSDLGEGTLRIRGLPFPIIKNCVIYGNESSSGLEDVDCQYSYVLNITYSDIGSGTYNPITNNHNLSQNPLFIGNYKLDQNSPCNDTGTNLLSVSKDIEDTPRPLDGNNNGKSMTDMGCYEFSHPNVDTDNDGATDSEEYIASTDPTDENSRLMVNKIIPIGENMHVVWSGGAKSRQYLEASDNPSDSDGWNPIYTNEPPTQEIESYDDPSSAIRFYRIRAQRD